MDGHHLAINFLVQGEQISVVIAFLDGEPAFSTSFGTNFEIFKDERDLDVVLHNGLTTSEISASVTSVSHSMDVGPADTP